MGKRKGTVVWRDTWVRKDKTPSVHAEKICCKKCQYREERRAIGKSMFNRGCFVEYCGKLIDGGAKVSEAICVLVLECPLEESTIQRHNDATKNVKT